MLLLLLLIVSTILFIALSSIYDDLFRKLIAIFCMCAIVLMSFVSIDAHINKESYLAKKQQEYESLVYQLENDLYDNDNDLGKKKLYDQIQQYNADVASGKKMQDNLWVGIMVEDIYDDLELIKYND